MAVGPSLSTFRSRRPSYMKSGYTDHFTQIQLLFNFSVLASINSLNKENWTLNNVNSCEHRSYMPGHIPTYRYDGEAFLSSWTV